MATPEDTFNELVQKLQTLVESEGALGIRRGGVFTAEDIERANAYSMAIEATNKQISRQASQLGDLSSVMNTQVGRNLTQTRTQFAQLKKQLEAVNKDFQDLTTSAEKYGSSAARAFKGAMGIQQGAAQSLTGLFVNLGANMKKAGSSSNFAKESYAELRREMSDFDSDITTASLHKLQEIGFTIMGLATQIDAMHASINLLTLSSNRYKNLSEDLLKDNVNLGASFEHTGETVILLNRSVHSASDTTQQYMKDIADLSLKLNVLGADVDTLSPLIQFYNKGLGVSAEQTKELLKETFKLGEGLEIGVDAAVRQLAGAFGQLSAQGDGFVRISSEIMAMSRATTVEMSSLLNVAGQFDTFEGAANAAASLNAAIGVMGGSGLLNATALHRMEEQERLKALHQTFNMQERSFNQLGKYEKLLLTNALGFQSAGEAAKFFGQSFEEYDLYLDKVQAAEAAQTDFEKAMLEGMPVMTQLKNELLSIAIDMAPMFMEILEVIRSLLETFRGLDPALRQTFVRASLLVPIFSAIGGWFGPVGRMVGAGLGVSGATGPPAEAFKSLFESLGTMGEEKHSGTPHIPKDGLYPLQKGEAVLSVASLREAQSRRARANTTTSRGAPTSLTDAVSGPTQISLDGANLTLNVPGHIYNMLMGKISSKVFDDLKLTS